MKRELMRRQLWDVSKLASVRRNYPTFGSDMRQWDQKLQYRQKKAIEAQARKLGLALGPLKGLPYASRRCAAGTSFAD